MKEKKWNESLFYSKIFHNNVYYLYRRHGGKYGKGKCFRKKKKKKLKKYNKSDI